MTDYACLAGKYRHHAALCEAFAASVPEYGEPFLAMAHQWRFDAEIIERDGIMVAKSRELLTRAYSTLGESLPE